MAKLYSEDLRRRVVETIGGGTTIPEAAEQCGSDHLCGPLAQALPGAGQHQVGQIRRLQGFRAGGHEDLVRELVAEQPDITLAGLEDREVVDLPFSASFEAAF